MSADPGLHKRHYAFFCQFHLLSLNTKNPGNAKYFCRKTNGIGFSVVRILSNSRLKTLVSLLMLVQLGICQEVADRNKTLYSSDSEIYVDLILLFHHINNEGYILSVSPFTVLKAEGQRLKNQASFSMRLLWKQLCCPLPSLFLLHSSALHLACDLFRLLSLSLFRWSSCYVGFPCLGNFSSWVVHHYIRLSLAEGTWTRVFVEQPIGAYALWNDPWLAEKCQSL